MSAVIWVLQWLMGALFLVIGSGKLARPYESMRQDARTKWVEDVSPTAIKWIGVAEVLAALGLVAPGLVGVGPLLTPLAALGLAMLMTGAVVIHIRRRETPMVAFTSVLWMAAVFLTLGRFVWEPLP